MISYSAKGKQILGAILAFGIPASINLCSIIVFTRILSLEKYGQLSYAWIGIEFLSGVCYGWIKMGMMRFFDNQRKTLFASIHILGAITLFIITASVTVWGSNICDLPIIYLLIICGIIMRGIAYFIQDLQRIANNTLSKFTVVSFFFGIAYYAPAMVMTILNPAISVEKILTLQIIGLGFLITFVSVPWLIKSRTQLFTHPKNVTYSRLLKFSLPLILSTIAIGFFTRIDRYLIVKYLSFDQLGIYSAGFNVANLAISSIFSIVTLDSYPKIIHSLNCNKQAEAKKIYYNNRMFFLLFMPSVLLLSIIFKDLICELLFAEKGESISAVFPFIVVATYLFNLKIHHFDQIFQFLKNTQSAMILSICTGLLHLLVSYYLIGFIGLYGVAVSSGCLSLLAIIVIYFYYKDSFLEKNKMR